MPVHLMRVCKSAVKGWLMVMVRLLYIPLIHTGDELMQVKKPEEYEEWGSGSNRHRLPLIQVVLELQALLCGLNVPSFLGLQEVPEVQE
ncbi:hypothetical protein NECAME_01835 [Necator americanus]|uniref:Uncharacterized protein n=1 Tax=Necator americanus TaxID=51031 RepID=W2TPH4_NECAM|nr:hypothetical protein NECAME_01835 [Necator americanus]ETN83036.1 hypothetical protein NECAME_01835 [Necator americanus]